MAKKRIKVWAVVLAIVILFLLIFSVGFFTGYKRIANLSYGERAEEVLDLYIPRRATRIRDNGCILFIHGGSWSGGDKGEEGFHCRYFANRGYVTATINYSLFAGDQSSYNVGIVMDQITAAFESIVKECESRGIRVKKGATSGYSAGAHLSMLYGYSCADKCPVELVFTANIAGPSDMSFEVWGDTGYRITEMLTGRQITDQMIKNGEADELISKISPTTYVNENSLPSIFAYGQKDTTVSIANGNAIRQKFQTFGVSHEFVLFPHSNHRMVLDIHKRLAYYGKISNYCKTYFGY